jgi:hypothetical protein
MKRTFATAMVLSLALFGTGSAFGQTSAPEQKMDADARTRTLTGIVKEYRVSKWLAIETGEKNMESFKLDDEGMLANVSDAVAVGTRVKVTEKVTNGGKRVLTVEPLPVDSR